MEIIFNLVSLKVQTSLRVRWTPRCPRGFLCGSAWAALNTRVPPGLEEAGASGVTLCLSFLLGVPLSGLSSATIPMAWESLLLSEQSKKSSGGVPERAQ